MNKRYAEAQAYYEQAQKRAAQSENPRGQKFPKGTRVRIAKDLGPEMAHFKNDCLATVEYTYLQAYGGGAREAKIYCLDIDGYGSCAWYHEWQLEGVSETNQGGG